MRIVLIVLIFSFSNSIQAKEWKNLKQYQKSTHNIELSPSDWFSSDRIQNTSVWKLANVYNLNNNKPEEYQNIIQRRDFYFWISKEFKSKGHKVIWQNMAYYISYKLRFMQKFPHCMFTSKKLKLFSQKANEVIFNSVFEKLNTLFNSDKIIKNEEAIQWDKKILYDEQYFWVESIYNGIDKKSLKQIEKIVKGKFIYALIVPKAIRFDGDISNPVERYQYALDIFRPFCENHFK